MRHRTAMLLREKSPETPSQRKLVRFLVVYLYWVFWGVTLADHADLPPVKLPSG
jgi:hypothetical protein